MKPRLYDDDRISELARSLDEPRRPGDWLPESFVRDLGEVLELERTLAYGLKDAPAGGREMQYVHCTDSHLESVFAGFVREHELRWAVYNPSRPEPAQRNRVLDWTAEDVATLAQTGKSPIARELYPKLGVVGRAQLRVVVCDGPIMLGWIGGWRADAFGDRERRRLHALVPALQQHLRGARLLAQTNSRRLETVLDAIGCPALLTDLSGRPREMNWPARVVWQRDRRGTREELRTAARGRAETRWSVTRVRDASGETDLLMIARGIEAGAHFVALAAARWCLTERQRDILLELADGRCNSVIAAILEISERTVEVHVSRLLERAGAATRAELIGKVFSFR
jgi:DNA-binding NarL/FixJ family response regulator